jgi:hypothetical protein
MGDDKRLGEDKKLGRTTGILPTPQDVPERDGNSTLGKVQ